MSEIYLHSVDKPVMPVITDVTASSTSITITWNQNTSSDVIRYELRYNFTIRECEIRSDNIEVGMINGSLRNYTLENSTETPVEEDSDYTIFLSAINFDGASDSSITEVSTQGSGESDLLLCHTKIDIMHTFLAPSGAPQNLSKFLTDDTIIGIEWEPVECRHRNGEVIGYNVTYYPSLRTELQISTEQFVPEPGHIFTATGLLFDEEYTFDVQAIGQQYGAGPSATTELRTSPLQGINL